VCRRRCVVLLVRRSALCDHRFVEASDASTVGTAAVNVAIPMDGYGHCGESPWTCGDFVDIFEWV